MTAALETSEVEPVADARRKFTPSRLRLRDLPAVSTVGPRTRRLHTTLTAIGIAALVAVMGISESSKADLLAELDALGTNRLQVQPGQAFVGDEVTLPDTAADRIRRLNAIEHAAAVSHVAVTVRRSDAIPEEETGGIAPKATDLSLPETIGATLDAGRWHDAASVRLPTVVLGSVAGERLGISVVDGRAVLIGDQLFTVIGILKPIPLYATLDTAVFVGYPVTAELFDTDTSPSTVYVTTNPELVNAVRDNLPATTNLEAPQEVDVTNPSDALAAKKAVDDTLTALLLGLGGVALLVGGIGIANVMVIGVLERRTEIGVRRALGATKRHIRLQFVLEATLLGSLGGIIGVGLGIGVTTGYAHARDLPLTIPPNAITIGLSAAILIGAIAGLSPASRAARWPPPKQSDRPRPTTPARMIADTTSLRAERAAACASHTAYVVDMRDSIRTAALGGVIGPAGFIGAWVTGAAATSAPYSSIDDAISRLAAVGSDTRWLQTAGFLTFGLSLPAFAWALRSTVPGRAWITAAATGLATLAVAATPLDHSDQVDRLHGIFAGVGYLTLAATPFLAARPLLAMGHRRLARSGIAAGLTSAIALALTTTGLPTGLFQRVGLTASDAWIIAIALVIRRGVSRPVPHAE